MLDFASSLYLGLRHESSSLSGWESFTTGLPAALDEVPEAPRLARQLARLQGCERATLAVSTLHLFWDLFGLLSDQPISVHLDDGAYATARWGAERAAMRQVPVRRFRHHDVSALAQQLTANGTRARMPVVVADGFCVACGKPAPVARYLECVRARGGLLVLDDTQALGILGERSNANAPYGHGGGGSLRFAGVGGWRVVLISSMAKAFGVPVAALSGSSDVVGRFEAGSETRVHCSPPSIAVFRALEHAFTVNDASGESLRARLLSRVRRFRRWLAESSLSANGGLFPVQTLSPLPHLNATALYDQLRRAGIRTVLRPGKARHSVVITAVVTARHTPADIDRIGQVLMDGSGSRRRSLTM